MAKHPPRLAILASGQGGNFQAILDACLRGSLPAIPALLISDQETAFAIERAKNAGIPHRLILKKHFPIRERFDEEIESYLREFKIDWIILAGFMRLLSSPFVKKFAGRIVNIHPSLLPDHKGLHAIEKAYSQMDEKMGVTVHFVDEGLDSGPVIVQEAFFRQPTWTLEETKEVVHSIEHRLYPMAIGKVLSGEAIYKVKT